MIKEDLSRNFGFLVHDVARLLKNEYDRRVRSLGVTRSQWWVLNFLYREDGVTQAELAETLDIERPTLGRILDRLELKGWIRRVEDRRDRRAKRVLLTNEVKPLIETMRNLAADLRQDALAEVSAERRKLFVDTLMEVKKNLSTTTNKRRVNKA